MRCVLKSYFICLLLVIINCNIKSLDNDKTECEPYGPHFSEPAGDSPSGSMEVVWRLLDSEMNESDVFLEGERIILEIKIYNKQSGGNGNLWMTNKLGFAEDYLYYEIYNENGDRVLYKASPNCEEEDYNMYYIPYENEDNWFIKISNSSPIVITNVIYFGGTIELNEWKMCNNCREFNLNDVGKYTIKGYYRNKDRKNIKRLMNMGKLNRFNKTDIDSDKLWMGKLDFRPIKFEIISRKNE